MTARDVFELATQGGAADLAGLIAACEALGPYCLIGGLAVDYFVEPVYTLDVEVVVSPSSLPLLQPYHAPESKLRIQFTIDERYQVFLARSVDAEVLGVRAKVACLEDVTQGKLWAYGDFRGRLSKRKKDELDLIRLAEFYPKLKSLYPIELRQQSDRG